MRGFSFENLKNHYIRVKNQSCRITLYMGIKTYQEKNTKPMKKLKLNWAHQLRENSEKPPKMSLLSKTVFSGGFLDFSLN